MRYPPRLQIPAWLRAGIRGNRRGFPNAYTMYAFDTETVDGEPFTLQWVGAEGTKRVESIERVTRTSVAGYFFDCLRTHGQARQINLLWAHSLEFDLGVVFVDFPDIWEKSRYQARDTWRGVPVTISLHHFDNPYHTVQIGDKKWLILDTMSFFRMSLARACLLLNLPVKKMARPRYLGTRKPTRAEWPRFQQYAIQDAWATWELGKFIRERHQEFNIRMSVSVANMASLIFRHQFLGDARERDDYETRKFSALDDSARAAIGKKFSGATVLRVPEAPRIPFPETTPGSNAVVVASMLAYHGGKNGLYVPPGVYPKVREVDIISAYPHAMKVLPPLTDGRWVRVEGWPEDRTVAGVFQVKGRMLRECSYGPFLSIEGDRKFHSGEFDTWVTSWEWASAIRHREVRAGDVVFGYVWEPAPGATNPFSVYVDYFFKRKQEAKKDDPRREMYKLLLNALYGKLIQRAEEPDPILGAKVVAGGLFNPFWAAQITGHCRARIHDLEHRYEAVHTSTDSILTRAPTIETGSGLGDLEVKAQGTAIMLRNKLYVLVDPATKVPVKWALHGFRGKVADLFRWLKKGGGSYSVHHMWRPREARRTGEKPFRMVRREFTLNLDPHAVHPSKHGGILSWQGKENPKPATRSSGRSSNGASWMSGSPRAKATRSRARSSP